MANPGAMMAVQGIGGGSGNPPGNGDGSAHRRELEEAARLVRLAMEHADKASAKSVSYWLNSALIDIVDQLRKNAD